MKINEILDEAKGMMDYDPRFDKHGSELDRDDDWGGVDFKAPRMFDQLAKAADNINGEADVKTDDGDTIKVKSGTAKNIMDLERGISQQGGKKEQFMKMIQTTDGLKKVIAYVEK